MTRHILEIPNHIHKSQAALKTVLEIYDGKEVDIKFIDEIPHLNGTAVIKEWITEIKDVETDPYKLFVEIYGAEDDQYHFFMSGWGEHKKMLRLKDKFEKIKQGPNAATL